MDKQAFDAMVRQYAADLMGMAARSTLPPEPASPPTEETSPQPEAPAPIEPDEGVEINPPESGPGVDPLQPAVPEPESYESFLADNPQMGELRIQASAGGRAVPISGAEVTVSRDFADGSRVFATGISRMIASIPGLAGTQATVSSLLVLTVSVFCLTSLDTATRLARYMFQEFWLKPGETYKDATGFKAILCNPVVATAITVVLGVGLGMTGYSKIWPLFGAANQLLAALALLTVCAWLGNIGRNNKMFYFPMAFMLVVTLVSLFQTVTSKVSVIAAGAASDWGPYAQAILGTLLFVLAIVLAVEGCMTIFGGKKPAQK